MDTLTLILKHEGERVGSLIFDPGNDEFVLTYASSWIDRKRFGISPVIGYTHPHPRGAVTRFLENLLPEGEWLKNLAQVLRVNPSNLYALIEALGKETTGALTISRNDERPQTSFRAVGREELSLRIEERRRTSITTWDSKPRLSIAGVQEKLPIVIRDGEFGFGEGDLASTHILKFGNPRARHLVINEFFCMRLASTIGLSTARCEMMRFNEPVLAVERFDREWVGAERVKRRHLIDGCQALDIGPKYKYERFLGDETHVKDITGPATLKNLFDFCTNTRVPAKARLDLLRWLMFNLLIGNSDCHVKNVSFFVADEGVTLAPFYDLLSVAMYPELEQSMAFHVGDTFEPNEVNAYHLAEMARELELRPAFVANHLGKMAAALPALARAIQVTDASPDELDFVRDLTSAIELRCQRFMKEANDIDAFASMI